MTRYRWVAARKAEGFPTNLCCGVAGVSRQGFYGWRARRSTAAQRESAEAALVAEIAEIWAASGETYGSPRVTAELRARGHRVNAKRIALGPLAGREPLTLTPINARLAHPAPQSRLPDPQGLSHRHDAAALIEHQRNRVSL